MRAKMGRRNIYEVTHSPPNRRSSCPTASQHRFPITLLRMDGARVCPGEPRTAEERHTLNKFLAISQSLSTRPDQSADVTTDSPSEGDTNRPSTPSALTDEEKRQQDNLTHTRADAATALLSLADPVGLPTGSTSGRERKTVGVRLKLRGSAFHSTIHKKNCEKMYRIHSPLDKKLHNQLVRPLGLVYNDGKPPENIVMRLTNGNEDGPPIIVHRSLIRRV